MKLRYLLSFIWGIITSMMFDNMIIISSLVVIGGASCAILPEYLPYKHAKIFNIRMRL